MAIVISLWNLFTETRRSSNLYNALLRASAASRILLFPPQLQALGARNPFRREGDRFSSLTHGFYLSSKLTLAQRIQCAIDHYAYEERNRGALYHDLVYGSSGLVLWHQIADGAQYSLRLCASEDNPHEGDLSVLLFVDDTRVCTMSFSYVNASVFGQAPGIAIFITRHQTERNEALRRFRTTFRQNSPQYFCLAALSGIAMLNGMRCLYAIKHDAQIAYEDRYEHGFRNSYSNFWLQFGAEESDPQAYRLVVPLLLKPLSGVKHRARAVARRHNWEQVIRDTQHAMAEHSVVDTNAERVHGGPAIAGSGNPGGPLSARALSGLGMALLAAVVSVLLWVAE